MDLYNLFASVVNMSVTAGWIIAVVLLARLALKRAPKIFSYVLWSVVLFRLLCPVSLPSPASWLGALELPSASSREAVEITGTGTETGAAAARNEILTESPSGQPAQVILNETEPDGPSEKTWEDLIPYAAYVWLAGGAAMLLAGVGSCFRFRRHLVGGYRLRGNIYLVDYLGSAFVAGLLRPKIYLPSDLPEEQMDYIIAHEQHHITRLDHLVRHLAYFALCLHWFNPLVWLAFILSGKDMEMSCDEAVLKKLGSRIRADYSASLLRLAMGKRIIAGGPLSFGEGDTKGRIQNLARWKKLKKWQSGLCVLMCLVILTACAANPTQEVVKSKNDGAFETGIQQTAPTSETGDITLSRHDSFPSTDGSVEYTWNIDETIEDQPMPVVEVVPRFLTGEDAKNLCTMLFGNAVFYEASTDNQQRWSKSLLQEKIRFLSQFASEEELSKYYTVYGAYSMLQEDIQRYTLQSETAPEEDLRTETDWTLKSETYYNGGEGLGDHKNQKLNVTTRVGEIDYTANLTVRDQKSWQMNMFDVHTGDGDSIVIGSLQDALLRNTESPTAQQLDLVEKKAQDIFAQMKELGLGTFQVADVSIRTPRYSRETEKTQYAIVAKAVPAIEGISGLLGHTGTLNQVDDLTADISTSYSPVYPMAYTEIVFNVKGELLSFYLDGLTKVKDVKNTNVATLSFEELFARAESHLSLYDAQGWDLINGDNADIEIEINQTFYGLGRIAASENEESYYYVPAISFRGTIRSYDRTTGELLREETETLVTINAIDGTII